MDTRTVLFGGGIAAFLGWLVIRKQSTAAGSGAAAPAGSGSGAAAPVTGAGYGVNQTAQNPGTTVPGANNMTPAAPGALPPAIQQGIGTNVVYSWQPGQPLYWAVINGVRVDPSALYLDNGKIVSYVDNGRMVDVPPGSSVSYASVAPPGAYYVTPSGLVPYIGPSAGQYNMALVRNISDPKTMFTWSAR
jgi:hypothetical protein